MKTFTVVLSPEPDTDRISVSCPAMPGAVSQGHGRDEALRSMRESMSGWYGVAVERGFGPLQESPEMIANWVREILQDRLEEGWDTQVEVTTLPFELPIPVG